MFISHIGSKRVTTPDEFRAATEGAGQTLNIRLTQPIATPGGAVEPNRPIPPGP